MENIQYNQNSNAIEHHPLKEENMTEKLDSNYTTDSEESFLMMENFLDQNIKVSENASISEKITSNYIHLHDGTPVKRVENQHYTVSFKYRKSDRFNDDDSERVICKHKNSDPLGAEIISHDEGKGEIVIVFYEDVGEIRNCYIKQTAFKIYDKISELLTKNKTKILHNSIYRGLYDLDNNFIEELSDEENHQLLKLNSSQKQFISNSFKKKITYLWGPPGTGKSQVLAKLVDLNIQREKRVLVVSSTNQAVDSLLDKLKETTTKEIWSGKKTIARIGNISPSFANSLEDVRFENVLNRNMIEEVAQLEELKNHEKNLNSESQSLDEKTKNFKKYEFDYFNIKSVQNKAQEREKGIELIKNELSIQENNLTEKQSQLNKLTQRNTIVKFFSKGKIKDLLKENEELIRNIQHQTDKINFEIERFVELRTNLKNAISEFENFVVFEKYAEMLSELNSTKEEIAQKFKNIKNEIVEVENKIDDFKVSILKEIQIIGTTCDSAILKYIYLGEFDQIILDEASMVPTPKIICNSLLSKGRMIISGDFRQLAPIPPDKINNKDYKDFLSRDIFDLVGIIDGLQENKNIENLSMLDTQYRYPAVICNFVSKNMYNNKLISSENKLLKKPIVNEFLSNPIIYIDTSDYEYGFVSNGGNKNFIHRYLIAEIISKIPNYISTGIISPFTAQASFYSDYYESKENITAGTVHKFQGDGKDVIIFDLVKGWGDKAPKTDEYMNKPKKDFYNFIGGVGPFDSGPRLMNVAITRAKEFLIFVGSKDYVDVHFKNDFIGRVSDYLYDHGKVIKARDLVKVDELEEDYIPKNLTKPLISFNVYEVDDYLIDDFILARKMITIISPFVSLPRLTYLAPHLEDALKRGVDVKFIIRPIEENEKILKGDRDKIRELLGKFHINFGTKDEGGFSIFFQSDFHQKLIFIDDAIVYKGSMNFLSWTGRVDESVDRFYDQDQALSWAINESTPSESLKSNSVSEIFKQMISKTCKNPDCKSRFLIYARPDKIYYCPSCKNEVPA